MCGVFGIFNHAEAANLAYLGLHALQHRGQESAGVVSNDSGTLHAVRQMGLVADVFDARRLALLPGRIAVGHVRYTTAGGSLPKNIQPLTVEYHSGSVAIAHNGNLVNADEIRDRLEHEGSIFYTNSDTEVILQLMARSHERDWVDNLFAALAQLRGAFSLVVSAGDRLVAARDPHGFRPLILGRIRGQHSHPRYGKDAWVVASETCAFDLIDAEKVRDIEPGELLVIDGDGLHSSRLKPQPRRFCVFEHVYFARPDSALDDVAVYEARVAMGRALAREAPAEADVVIPVPDSGVVAALGYAKEAGLPFEMGLIRNHYVGRTFIEPKDSIRHFGVKLKLNALPALLAGKRVVVVDDSIVRGTTSRKIVKMIRAAGASEVHVRISSPPVSGPCYYGIDTPTRAELIASSYSVDETARFIEADSLGYLSPEGLLDAVRRESGEAESGDVDEGYCSACFTGRYPVELPASAGRRQLRLIEV
ncbi:amidophosphoribosyltransferase [Pseudenhygromyxa sp. WMMC2535]|uniref:amidophosphoribosyltransferase n=1 Tax=Pseudenhygromyxa sp. WMMC2535 TaxID=2712867 RepID=UPI0015551336|nr:amidophosphoribosyltransferase [Pseudenhygromyxa sp. WMMC2535]NVB41579.1 amidophosphoribosyltransferase [Pseudenhygromyxa sp. WMMC2535]